MPAVLFLGFIPELDRWTAGGLLLIGVGVIFAMTAAAMERR